MVWIVIGIVCVVIFGVLFFLTRNYQKAYVSTLDKKEHSLKICYPLCLFLLLETRLGNLLEKQEKEREILSHLHIGEDAEEMQILHWCKKMSTLFVVMTGCIGLICVTAFQGSGETFLKEGRYIERQKTGQGEKNVTINVSGDNREETSVSVYPMTEQEIWDYIDSGEPMDKAGAYGIQDLGALLVRSINGDYYNVMGLPVGRLLREMRDGLINN